MSKAKVERLKEKEAYTLPLKGRMFHKKAEAEKSATYHVTSEEVKHIEEMPLETTYPDPFVGVPQVNALPGAVFCPFVKKKDVVMIFFYDPCDKMSQFLKVHVAEAAKATKRENHAYAAIDCSYQKDICESQRIEHLPIFKLYVRGNLVGKYDDSVRAWDLKKFVETAPLDKHVIPAPPRKRHGSSSFICWV